MPKKRNVEFNYVSEFLVLEDCILIDNNMVNEVVVDFVQVIKVVHDIVPIAENIYHDHNQVRFTQILDDDVF